ncbi:hypothetical protein C5F59_035505 [Streptomyces sp. QL37]|uniref:hypothetical protein n=1 Tax=Streptomyces sp. QL37 TaxID=2093747 RepID=UPI001C9E4B59|nr:hypothetical protein [Streptomyces sp. QL37]
MVRRRAGSESAERIPPDLFISTGKRKDHDPSVAGGYRALVEHAKREAYPEAVAQAHADVDALRADGIPGPRPVTSDRASLG